MIKTFKSNKKLFKWAELKNLSIGVIFSSSAY